MKKIIFLLVVISFLVVGCEAFAEESLPDPGILPDSSFYFLKAWKENIQTFFAFGEENKARQYLHLAEVRLAEYQKMIEKGKDEIAQKVLDKYEKQLNNALAKTEELKNKGRDAKDFSVKIENLQKVFKESSNEDKDKDKKPTEKNEEPKPKTKSENKKETLSALDKFTKCLNDKGVKMYGASWCSHCTNQKNMFGTSLKYLPYIECAVPDGGNQTLTCQNADIRAYPTWIFPNGEKNEGALTFEELGQYSGCELKQ